MLFDFYKSKFTDNVVLEADDDNQQANATQQTEPDDQNQATTQEDDDENYDMGDVGEEDQETNQEDQPQEDQTEQDPGEDDDENYDMGDDEGTDDDTIDTPEDQPQDDTMQGTDENDPRKKLRDLEASIFDQLSDDQKKLKIGELKELYTDTYEKAKNISTMVAEMEKNPEHAKIYDYVINALSDLRKYIQDYLNNVFDSKTYIENLVEFQKYLTIFDTINNIFIDIRDSKEEK